MTLSTRFLPDVPAPHPVFVKEDGRFDEREITKTSCRAAMDLHAHFARTLGWMERELAAMPRKDARETSLLMHVSGACSVCRPWPFTSLIDPTHLPGPTPTAPDPGDAYVPVR